MEIRIPKQNKTYFFVFSIVELTRNNNNKKRGQKYMEVGHTPFLSKVALVINVSFLSMCT